MKSIQQIHQQTLDIIARLSVRKHTMSETIDRIIRIHNRYIDKIAVAFGYTSCATMPTTLMTEPVRRQVYAEGIAPAYHSAQN